MIVRLLCEIGFWCCIVMIVRVRERGKTRVRTVIRKREPKGFFQTQSIRWRFTSQQQKAATLIAITLNSR